MASLPFLIRIRSVRDLKKPVVLLCRHFVIAQMIVSAGAKKIAHWNLGQKLGARIGGLDRELVVFVLVGGHCQIAVGLAEIGLELDSSEQLLLGVRILQLFQKCYAEVVMELSALRVCGQHGAEQNFRLIVFFALQVEVAEIGLGKGISGIKLQRFLKLSDCVVIFAENEEDAGKLQSGGDIFGMHGNDLAQNGIGLSITLPAHGDVGQSG